jgi:peptide deformylase
LQNTGKSLTIKQYAYIYYSQLAMTILPIRVYPDPVLLQEAREITDINGEVQKLIDAMAATMYKAPGLGLAANQVGDLRRIIVFDVAQREGSPKLQVMLNPRIVACEGEIVHTEGCLSVPDYSAEVRRHGKVCVAGLDREGNPLDIEADGLLAVVLQHEIDHLHGKLFIDRISRLKRGLYIRKIKKQAAAG